MGSIPTGSQAVAVSVVVVTVAVATGLIRAVVRFRGEDVILNFEFLKDESVNVAISLESEDALLKTLRPGIKRWCKSE